MNLIQAHSCGDGFSLSFKDSLAWYHDFSNYLRQ